MTSLLVLNGPNLNLLGQRQPEIYGATTLAEIEALCIETGAALGLAVICEQSNHEGVLIDAIHAAPGSHAGIVLNAGAFTHSSVAIRDAVAAIDTPVIELHLSNTHAREPFRHRSYLAPVVLGQIAGFGPVGYDLAIRALARYLERN